VAFGEIPPENPKATHRDDNDRHVPAPSVIGNEVQMKKLVSLWEDLDDDRSGNVDMIEFRHCFEPKLRKRFSDLKPGQVLPIWATPSNKASELTKFVTRVSDSIARHLFSKQKCVVLDEDLPNQSFYLEDMLELLYPDANPADLKNVRAMFGKVTKDIGVTRTQVKPPPVLRAHEYKELCAVFNHYCDNDKLLSFKDMVAQGLIDHHQGREMSHEWDLDGINSKLLNSTRFCEVMCPSGFRATAESITGSTEDGDRVVLNPVTGHWDFRNRELRSYSKASSDSSESALGV
jgi:hypothetical protein